MRKALIAIAAAGLLGTLSDTATAATSFDPSAGQAASPNLIYVAGGCGIGFHRGPYGGCRPNRGFVGPRRFYGRRFVRRCFWRRGAFGRLVRVCR